MNARQIPKKRVQYAQEDYSAKECTSDMLQHIIKQIREVIDLSSEAGMLIWGYADGCVAEGTAQGQPAAAPPSGGVPASSAAVRTASSSAGVSEANLLIATTTGTPYARALAMWRARLQQPAATSSTFSVRYVWSSGLPAVTGGPPPCIFSARTATTLSAISAPLSPCRALALRFRPNQHVKSTICLRQGDAESAPL